MSEGEKRLSPSKTKILSNFKYLNKSQTRLQFEVSNYRTIIALANTLRRAPLELIPIWAISKLIWIEPNKTSAIDEFLEHRIMEIPIINEGKTDEELEDLGLELNVSCEGPENRFVTGADFRPENYIHPDHIVTILKPGQQINVSCRLSKGFPIENAKFQSCKNPDYWYPEPAGEIPKKIIISYKAIGPLKVETILRKSIEGIQLRTKNLSRALTEQNKEKINVTAIFGTKYNVMIRNETFTIGHLLASIMSTYDDLVIYSVCTMNHPLEDILEIKLTLKEEIKETPEQVISMTLEEIDKLMDKLLSEVEK